MLDINKYLETQLALAKQKCATKCKIDKVSDKSRAAADAIAKKQVKNLKDTSKDSHKIPVASSSRNRSTSSCKNSDDDDNSDYLPSGDEEEDVSLPFAIPSSRNKLSLKKIVDDGDNTAYNNRVKDWKENLAASLSGKSDIVSSADVQYILKGNKDPEEVHELQNGLCVPNYIWKQLYKYQRIGVKWLWELHQIESGGLLGDEMGLGKTVQIIAFLSGLSKSDAGKWGGLGPSIIVAPATVIYQWVAHFHFWYPPLRVAVLHHSGSHVGNHNKLIRDLHASHGVLLITYAGIVKYNKDLMSRNWHYIILDEGHKIRNPDTQVSKLVKQFKTPHRLLITGSPMQNSLQELWSLFDFMRPGLLGTYAAFMEYFAQPITQGGYANATQLQEATALEIAKTLKDMITPYMIRRTKNEVQEHIKLPEKNEQVLFCALSQEQKDLYIGYLTGTTVRSILDKDSKFGDPLRARILVALTTLRKICNHPDLYLYEAQDDCEEIDEERFGYWKRSGKMSVVHSLLKIWQKQNHRALIFSQSRAMLCVLEHYLQRQGYKYLKMDGSVSVGIRQNIIKTFNENSEYLVFLATTRVGGLGVNLTGANRVIIYDPDWNPATDSQAKERAWRIGQQKNVTVYRLLSAGTIEEKIYQRQIFKCFLSNKILIDPNQRNVLTTSTLQGLFTLEDVNHEGDTETASLFKHTKVDFDNNKEKKDDIHLSGGVSFSKQKLEAMRRKAREISKNIANNAKTSQNNMPEEDPREKYKIKRELLLNPPKVEEAEINLIDDKVTNVPFENVLSEIDIINMHTKENYEANLIKEVLLKPSEEVEDGEIPDNGEENLENKTILAEDEKLLANKSIETNKNFKSNDIEIVKDKINNDIGTSSSLDLDTCNPTTSKVGTESKHSHKRKHSELSEPEIESLVAVKKVKKKKRHKEKIEKETGNDDDYVLNKLFAKAGVKNVLHHDGVIGLAEKEKRHRMKEEATKKARLALKAVRFSHKDQKKVKFKINVLS